MGSSSQVYVIRSHALYMLSSYKRVQLLVKVYFHLQVIYIPMLLLFSRLVSVDVYSHLVVLSCRFNHTMVISHE
jgi:hypothetical protein